MVEKKVREEAAGLVHQQVIFFEPDIVKCQRICTIKEVNTQITIDYSGQCPHRKEGYQKPGANTTFFEKRDSCNQPDNDGSV